MLCCLGINQTAEPRTSISEIRGFPVRNKLGWQGLSAEENLHIVVDVADTGNAEVLDEDLRDIRG